MHLLKLREHTLNILEFDVMLLTTIVSESLLKCLREGTLMFVIYIEMHQR